MNCAQNSFGLGHRRSLDSHPVPGNGLTVNSIAFIISPNYYRNVIAMTVAPDSMIRKIDSIELIGFLAFGFFNEKSTKQI